MPFSRMSVIKEIIIRSYEDTQSLSLNNLYPVADGEGLTGDGCTFTVRNIGTLPSDYKVMIQDDAAIWARRSGSTRVLTGQSGIFYFSSSDGTWLEDTSFRVTVTP